MEQRKISISSIVFALLFYTVGVWANENEAFNVGSLFTLMAIMLGCTAILFVITSSTLALVISTIVMLIVGAYLITPIASEAMQEMMNLLLKALMEAIDSTGWVTPVPPAP